MLTIKIEATELYDSESNTFITIPEYILSMEHSLYSLSKWESITKESLIDKLEHGLTTEETLEYIKCMDLNEPPTDKVYLNLNKNDVLKIQQYIDDPHSATTITTVNNSKEIPMKRQKITAEIIYYWMIESDIPFECEHWNLNKLLMLIKVVSAKRSNTKMSKKDLKNYNRSLMAKRRGGHK